MVIVAPGVTVGTGPWNGPLGGWSFKYGPTQDAFDEPLAFDVTFAPDVLVTFDGLPHATHRSSSPDAPSRRIRGWTFSMRI